MQKTISYKWAMKHGRLWLSYQRYALLAFIIAGFLLWTTAAFFKTQWWFILSGGVLTLSLVGLGIRIMAQTGKKMAITQRAYDRIRDGVFEPTSMMKYCTDPCWRVVVSEVLREAKIPSTRRRVLISQFSKEAVEASKMLVLVNRHDNLIYTVDGTKIEVSPLTADS